MQAFIDAYRSVHPYDATGANHAARLTIDLAAGDRWLIDLTAKATTDWLRTDQPVLDYANAMVPSRQPTATAATANWQEHVDGKSQYAPPIPPLAPAKFTGSLYIAEGSKALSRVRQLRQIAAVRDAELRGGRASQRSRGHPGHARLHVLGCGTTLDARCRDGAAQYVREGRRRGATALNVPIPMPALRQQ